MQPPDSSTATRSILLSALIHAGVIGAIIAIFLLGNHFLPESHQAISIGVVSELSSKQDSIVVPKIPIFVPRSDETSLMNASKTSTSNTSNVTISGQKTENGEANAYFLEIQRRIQEQERYPIEAKKRGISGSIVVQFRLSEQGQIIEIKSISQGKSQILIEAALAAVKAASPFRAPPAGISKDFRIPVDFKIK
jgi:TonB family protein